MARVLQDLAGDLRKSRLAVGGIGDAVGDLPLVHCQPVIPAAFVRCVHQTCQALGPEEKSELEAVAIGAPLQCALGAGALYGSAQFVQPAQRRLISEKRQREIASDVKSHLAVVARVEVDEERLSS